MRRPKRDLAGCRVLITGASSGIGRALGRAMARRGARLLLTARREHRLRKVAAEVREEGGAALLVGGDVTDAELRRALIQTAREQLGGLDLLVNNAGVGAIGAFATADAARLRLVMETNFFAVAELIRDALPLLVDGADPAIVNIGSVLGHCAVPKKSEYCASKFALHGFTDALRMELAGDGVEVILVSPSTTDSEFFGRAMRSEGQASEKRRAMSAESVAEQAVRAIVKRRREVILSLGGRSLVWADRLFPGWTSRLLERFA